MWTPWCSVARTSFARHGAGSKLPEWDAQFAGPPPLPHGSHDLYVRVEVGWCADGGVDTVPDRTVGVDDPVVHPRAAAGGVQQQLDAVIAPDGAIVPGDLGDKRVRLGLIAHEGDIERLTIGAAANLRLHLRCGAVGEHKACRLRGMRPDRVADRAVQRRAGIENGDGKLTRSGPAERSEHERGQQ